MTDPFGPLPQRKSRGSGYSTTSVIMAVISVLSGIFVGLLERATSISVTWQLVITALAAIAAAVLAALAKSKKEARAGLALLTAAVAIVVTVLAIAI